MLEVAGPGGRDYARVKVSGERGLNGASSQAEARAMKATEEAAELRGGLATIEQQASVQEAPTPTKRGPRKPK